MSSSPFATLRYSAVVISFATLGLTVQTPLAHAQPFEKTGFYQVNGDGWIKSELPDGGDVFTCARCEFPVQIRILYGTPPNRMIQFQSNEMFLQTLRKDSAQRDFARGVMEDLVPKDTPIDILDSGMSELGGLKTFRFQAATKLGMTLSRQTIWMAIHRDLVLMVALNYFEGGLDEPSRNQVRAFISNIRFL